MNLKVLFSLAAVAIFAISGSANAENGHAYNGSYCNPYFGNQSADFNHQWDGLSNTSTGSRWVSCPVVVDEIANLTGTSRIWVRWDDGGAGSTLTCYLYAMNVNADVGQSQSASDVGGGWFSIPNITTDDFWGNYILYCYLPNRGVLNTVWLGENN